MNSSEMEIDLQESQNTEELLNLQTPKPQNPKTPGKEINIEMQ